MVELILNGVLIGLGATLAMDVWAVLVGLLPGQSGPNWALPGRWFREVSRGRVVHDDIAAAPPYVHEVRLGWIGHYAVGVVYGVVFALIMGPGWFAAPTLPAGLDLRDRHHRGGLVPDAARHGAGMGRLRHAGSAARAGDGAAGAYGVRSRVVGKCGGGGVRYCPFWPLADGARCGIGKGAADQGLTRKRSGWNRAGKRLENGKPFLDVRLRVNGGRSGVMDCRSGKDDAGPEPAARAKSVPRR